MFDTDAVKGYKIGELIRSDNHSCTYHVVDGSGNNYVLKVVTEGMCLPRKSKPIEPIQRNNSTEWRSTLMDSFKYRNSRGQDMHCFVYKEDAEDYFSFYECSSIRKSEPVKDIKLRSIKYETLNTPTPYGGMQPATIACDNDDDDDDDDDEDDDEDEEIENSNIYDDDYETDDSSDSDSEDEDMEVNIIVNKGDKDTGLPPILAKENSNSNDEKEHIHFVNNPLLQNICHRQHKQIVRTPIPGGCGVPSNFNQQNLTCQKDHFKLEMLQSSMLKRRSTSSAGHLA
ncbi:hypothetical protein RNJ44_03650 [Nakaseomyces bracarensis]|uniref:Uncharacterized protein n=1 Tax=Nakaseomyces bracarensis TaxID=273131 RepID=A0ABR4NXH6_9SACH